MGQVRPGLARVVVELHEAEDQVGGHELELVRRVCDHVPAEQTWENEAGGGGGIKEGEAPTSDGQRGRLNCFRSKVPFCTRAGNTEVSVS